MSTKKTSLLAGLLLALPLALPPATGAEPQAKNPDYAHALPDLRTARYLLEAPPGTSTAVRTDEEEAIKNIDSAIRVATQGGFNDHKAVTDHEQIAVPSDQATRLQKALELLHRAHAYLSKEATDTMGTSVRNQTLDYIDKAERAVGRAQEAH